MMGTVMGPMRSHAASGFTLIELLVVVAILGAMLWLIGVGAKPVSPATQARSAAQDISGALRAARSNALMNNRSIAFTLDLASSQYQWGTQPAHSLPSDIKLALMTGRDQVVSENRGRIRFDPDGGSSGGRVSILGGGQLWMVGVDWLSGRVSVVHGAH
jgi:general secretion pathway protein H